MLYIASPGADVAYCDAIYSESRRRCGVLRAPVQLRVIQPYIPVRNPRLSESVYADLCHICAGLRHIGAGLRRIGADKMGLRRAGTT